MSEIITGSYLELNVKNSEANVNKIYGKSEQEIRSGKNVLNVPKELNFSGYKTVKDKIPAGTYIISCKEMTHQGNQLPYIKFNDNNKGQSVSPNMNLEITLETDETIVYIYSNGYNATGSQEVEATINELMISKDGGEYEEYGVMPSPEFQSPIKSVADDVNILQFNDIEETTRYGVTYSVKNGIITLNGTATSSFSFFGDDFNLDTSDYTLAVDFEGEYNKGSGNDNISFIIQKKTDEAYDTLFEQTPNTKKNTKSVEKTVCRPRVYFGTGNVFNNFKIKPKLQKGSKITPYSVFGKGTVKIIQNGQNWIDLRNIKQQGNCEAVIENNILKLTIKNTGLAGNIYFNCNLKAGDYYVHFDKSIETMNSSSINLAFYNSKGQKISGSNNIYSSSKITLTDEATEMRIYFGTNINKIEIPFEALYINEGTENLGYTPYQGQDVVVQTKPLRSLPNGVCDEKNGSRTIRRVGEVILDGVTAGKKITYPVKGTYGWAFGIAMSNMKKKDYPEYHLYEALLCSHYKPGNGDQNSKNSYDGLIRQGSGSSGNRIWIYEKLSNIKATDTNEAMNEYNQWLAEQYAKGTPVTVCYELAEPEIEENDEIEKSMWEKLQNIKLYDGPNYFITSSTINPEIEVEYYKSVEKYNFYISENGYLNIPKYNIKYLIDFLQSNLESMPEATESAVKIAGKDGDIPLNTIYEPHQFNIVCYTEDNLTLEQKVLEEENINRFLNSIKNKTNEFAIESKSKFYNVKYNGAMTTINYPKHLQFNIPLKSSEAYAMYLIENKMFGNETKESKTIEKVGPIITIIGPAQTPKISLNNQTMFYDNVILEGNKLEINCKNSTATLINKTGTKTNAMTYYNHIFPKIVEGQNELKILSGISSNEQVIAKWYDLKI